MKMHRFIALSLFFLFHSMLISAQDVKITNYYANIIGVSVIVSDDDTLWVGHKSGVLKILKDGTELAWYSKSNGLRINNVSSIAIDHEGNKWFGTQSGVSKFDGKLWTSYSVADGLIDTRITSIAIDKYGNKWFGTRYDGISKFDGVNWTAYSTNNGLVSNQISCITIDNSGNIWCATYDNRVSMFDGVSWTTYDQYKVYSIAIDHEGNKWFASEYSLSKFDGQTWKDYTYNDGLLNEKIRSICIDNAGNVIVGYSKAYVSILTDSKWETYKVSNTNVADESRPISVDADGKLWVGIQDDAGLYRLNNSSFEAVSFGDIAARPSYTGLDSEDNKWCVGLKEVSVFEGNSWRSIPLDSSLFDSRSQIEFDKNNVTWFCNGSHLLKYDGNSWTKFTTADGLISNNVRSVTIDSSGAKWFATDKGISILDGSSWRKFTEKDGLARNRVYDFFIDNTSNIWALTDNGVSKFNGSSWVSYLNSDRFDGSDVNRMANDIEGTLWFATFKGIYSFDGTTFSFHSIFDELGYGGVSQIAFDIEGSIWLATTNGIKKFDGNTWTTYSISDGLISNKINSVSVDKNNCKWFGTDKGVMKFDGKTWTKYTVNEGVILDNVYVITIDSNGEKWAMTPEGYFRLQDGGPGPLVKIDKPTKGFIFYDKNKNGKRDFDEPMLSNQYVQIKESKRLICTDDDGQFQFHRYDGHYTLSVLPRDGWETTTPVNISFDINNNVSSAPLEFGLAPKENIPELSAQIDGTRPRAFFDTRYWLNVTNTGVEADPIHLEMHYSPLLTYTSSTVTPASVADNIISWDISGLPLFSVHQIAVDFKVPGIEHLGDTIVNTVLVSATSADLDSLNNKESISQIITGSYDPNDKTEHNGIMDEGYTLFGKRLSYTVRFQNSGTDTAFNIQITDTLDANLLAESLCIESASHPYTFSFSHNVLKVKFTDIFLPDSIVNEPASHGYFRYGIDLAAGVEENAVVQNTAHIYFDSNPAIATNTTINTFVRRLPGTVEHTEPKSALVISPIPVRDNLQLPIQYACDIFFISDAMGREIHKGIANGHSIDVSTLPAGYYILTIGTDRCPFTIQRN